MAWFYLGLAAIFEVTFAMSMKYSEGFTNVRATVVTVVAVIAGIGFLTYYITSHFFTSLLPWVLGVGLIAAPWVIVRSAANRGR